MKTEEIRKKYLKMPYLDWDLSTPICLYESDQMFHCIEDALDYLEESEIKKEEAMFVICKPNFLVQVEEAWICEDIMPEDWEDLSEGNKLISDKIQELNKLISEQPAFSWDFEGIYRTSLVGFS